MSSGRESVESFVFVFLFFLVLGLEAEGFVIPTGSMAPTLMGRHKQVTCPECGLVYAVNADRELNDPATSVKDTRLVVAGVCVNCRFLKRIGDEPNFQGDRIYVIKTPLTIAGLPGLGRASLGRWDVAVFKLPEEPEVRYIKRLVGMPGEVVRILRGDIWVRPVGNTDPFVRASRALKHQEAMQQLVYDDSHRARSFSADRRWDRWTGDWAQDRTEPGVYRVPWSDDAWSELRYAHLVPDPVQWTSVREGRRLPHPPRASLITDFSSYNTDLTPSARSRPREAEKAWRHPHWVGDLTIKFRLKVEGTTGRLRVELLKAGIANRCDVDLATGLATLSHGADAVAGPLPCGIKGPGTYEVSFANVDDRLTLRVDGALPFGEGAVYQSLPLDPLAPTAADLSPVGIAVKGSAARVDRLVLTRDIYYTLEPAKPDYDRVDLEEPLPTDPVAFFDWLADPRRFAAFGKIQPDDYPIAEGRYMMLGDNSPWSLDGRKWERGDQVRPDAPGKGWDASGRESWEVPEALLIGKAFCVYWPHLQPVWPAFRLGKDVRLPAVPDLSRMRWIR